MDEVSTVGIDLAKSVFQVHGSDRSGAVVLRKKLRRDQVLSFFSTLPRCVVAMEACASAHYWAREIAALGHDTRLIPPAYVKPFVKRQKNDMADAEAICEAAQRPTMRFVQGKSAEAQASAVVFRTRDLLVRQRTQLINALRGHLTEFGYIVRQGVGHVGKLAEIVRDPASDIPPQARPILMVIAQGLEALQAQIAVLDREIASRAKADPVAKRLMTIPGVGPVIATALVALAPAASTFRRGRDFAAWLGLVPRQHSSGGKERLGRTTKMGERSLRRLLIIGASSVTKAAARDPNKAGAWLASMLTRSRTSRCMSGSLCSRLASGDRRDTLEHEGNKSQEYETIAMVRQRDCYSLELIAPGCERKQTANAAAQCAASTAAPAIITVRPRPVRGSAARAMPEP